MKFGSIRAVGQVIATGSISSATTTILTGSSQLTNLGYAITGSNTFTGTQTMAGSIIPSTNNTYDLGSPTYQFRHVYISSGSLYVNGTKVLGSTSQELQITTDVGQSFKILEAGSDTITLQSADGNITLTSSGGGDVILDPNTGVIALKGTTTIYSGNKIVSSDGNAIQFGNGITITGSIVATGTSLVSGSSQITFSGLSGVPSGLISGSAQESGFGYATTGSNTFQGAQTINGSLNVVGNLTAQQYIVSSSVTYLTESFTSGSHKFGDSADDYHDFTGSVRINGSITSTSTSLVSGSSQISYTGLSGVPSGIISGSSQLPSGIVSGSAQVDVMSTTNITRLATTGSNTFNGNIIVTGNTTVGGYYTFSSWTTGTINKIRGYSGNDDKSIQWNYDNNPAGTVIRDNNSILISVNSGSTLSATSTGVSVSGSLTTTGTLSLGASWVGGTNVTAGYYQDNINAAYRAIVTSGNSAYYFQTNAGSSSYMYVGLVGTYAGRVGIGTNNVTPNATLDVNGNTILSGSLTTTDNIVLSKAVDPKISSGTNIGLNIDGAALYLNRYSQSNIAMVPNGGNVIIGSGTTACALDISSRTDAIALPKGTTAQRPSASSGMVRFNTTNSKPEYYNGSIWVTVGASGDGSSYSNAASSAKSIKAIVGNPTSGVYWLQVANVNSGNPFQCYCDFTMDGGIGYAIIYNQYFTGAETGPSHADFGASTISTAGFDSEYQINPTAMISNYGLTKLAVFARTGGSSSNGITGASYFNWVAFTGPTTTQYNLIFTNSYNSNQFTGTFNSSDGNTGTAYFPNSHGNTGGVTQISTNGGTVNDYILYEYKQGTGTDPNHFWMVANGRSGDVYWVTNNRYGSSSGNVMYNRYGGVALY